MADHRRRLTVRTLALSVAFAWTQTSTAAAPAPPRLDRHFGRHGRVHVPGALARLDDVRIDRSDRLVLRAGTTVARFRANGRPDRAFGRRGRVDLSVVDARLGIDADNRIVAAGRSGSDIALVALTSAGEPDDTFGDHGVVATTLGGSPHDLLVSDDGIVVVGTLSITGELFAARWRHDGTVDDSFGAGGVAMLPLDAPEPHVSGAIVLDGGKLLLVVETTTYSGLLRVTRDGVADDTFRGTLGTTGLGRLIFGYFEQVGHIRTVVPGASPGTLVAVEYRVRDIHPGIVSWLASYDETGARTIGAYVQDTYAVSPFGDPVSYPAIAVAPDGTIIVASTDPQRRALVVDRLASESVGQPGYADGAPVSTRIRPGGGSDPPLLAVQSTGRLIAAARLCDSHVCRATLLGYRLP